MINPKHIIISWKHQGSVFCKDSIRENFPELVSFFYFYKTHETYEQTSKKLDLSTIDKIFFVISDPRNSAINLNFYKQYGDFSSEYKIPIKYIIICRHECSNQPVRLKNSETVTRHHMTPGPLFVK